MRQIGMVLDKVVGGRDINMTTMNRYRFIALIFVAGLVPASADLVDMGFFNKRARPTDVVLEYNTGKRSDMHLKPYEAVLERGLPGEMVARIHIYKDGQKSEIVLASTIRAAARYRGAAWLCISDGPARVISPDEVGRLRRNSQGR